MIEIKDITMIFDNKPAHKLRNRDGEGSEAEETKEEQKADGVGGACRNLCRHLAATFLRRRFLLRNSCFILLHCLILIQNRRLSYKKRA